MIFLIEALKKTPLFASMDDQTVVFFASKSRHKHYNKGEELFAMGDPALNFFFIINGWIKLYRISREGEETIINVFASSETFAEAFVFDPKQCYPVNAQAVEDTIVLEVSRFLFVEKIKENSGLALSVLGSIAAHQRYLIQQIEQLTVKEAPQRLGSFLVHLCEPGKEKNVEISLPYDKLLIARRLNIQPETFSRALKKLEPYGVSVKGHVIFIHDVKKLATFCDIDSRQSPC